MMSVFDKNRKRRVIYNDDAEQQFSNYEGYGQNITDEQTFLDERTTPLFDTQVDTYVWCVGKCASPHWRKSSLWPCLGSMGHAADLIVEACHAHGMEVWGSLRMNNVHDSLMVNTLAETSDPLKAEHLEYLIAPEESRHLTAFIFARPEVRRHRLEFIEKNAAAHDFDGYELDFTRFIWYFPLGQERKHAGLMTDLVRRARALLDAIGERRGRPYALAVHVPDSPATSIELGLDVEAWLAKGLVDVLVVGMGYMPYMLPLSQWLELGRRYRVPVYPSVDLCTYAGDWMKLNGRSVLHESLRASSAYYWQEGADGLYLCNLFCHEDRNIAELSRDYVLSPLQEIGDPALMKQKEKLYGVQPTADRGNLQQGSEATPLPVVLDKSEYMLDLVIGPDAADPRAEITIRALASGGDSETKVWFRLNHTLLEPEKAGDWYTAKVPEGVMHPGRNGLAIWCNAALARTENPVVIRRIFVPVNYAQSL